MNGHYLGKHAGAFSRFRFDASAALKPSGQNLLVVRADNSRPQPGSSTENVIPLSGDFFVFGGIYRGVALIATDPVHVDLLDYGGPGLYARTERCDSSSAAVRVSAKLVNDGSKPRTVIVETRIENDAKVMVASESSRVSVSPMQPVTIDNTLHVGRPRLWQGVKDPYLYELIMTVRSSQGLLLDQVVQPLGVRSLSIDPDKGLFLNGEHLFLKGASMHQDRPGKGWAISHADQAQDFELLRDLGGRVPGEHQPPEGVQSVHRGRSYLQGTLPSQRAAGARRAASHASARLRLPVRRGMWPYDAIALRTSASARSASCVVPQIARP